ncbi:hypothetical protein OTU49_014064, partial [Cherax quadricarinatus]
MKVLALQKLSWDVVIEWLHSFQLEDKAKVLAVYQYLLPAAPLLAKLAASCQYYDNPHLTQLFLPILVLKGKIHVTTYNIKQVLSYWEDSLHNSGVSHITHLKVEDITSQQYLSFLPLLGHLTNLQVLVIGSFVGDDLLAVLGMNCHHLVIFDVREEDMGNLITDVGLAFLAHCRKLRRVYFSEFADEYDCSDEQLRFTGKGVSLLLLLPEIEHIQCSEYILRDALHFLYQATYNKQTIAVQHLMLDHEEVTVNTLQTLPILCPKLEVLALRSDPDWKLLENMVTFVCDSCGACLKKNQMDTRWNRRCFNRTVSRMDCGKTFRGQEYASHLKGITEAEKCGGSRYMAKEMKDKKKQETWIAKVREKVTKTHNMEPHLKELLDHITT